MKTFQQKVGIIALLSLTACNHNDSKSVSPVLEEKIEIANHKIQTRLSGDGAPTVVLISGAESPLQIWQQVQNEASFTHKVLAYDRAGYGASDAVKNKRDGETVVAELHDLLSKKSLTPPYILVAHSLGGAFAQLYAAKFKNEVKGLVMVDCTSDAELRLTAQLPEEMFEQIFAKLKFSGTKAELKSLGETIQQIQMKQGLPDVPLIVITNTKAETGETPADKEKDWKEQGEWLKDKTTAWQWKAMNGHLVPLNEPSLIMKAITELSK